MCSDGPNECMLMNLSEATDVVKGMLHTYCLLTNVDRGDICAQRAHFLMTCAQKCAQNLECMHGTCPVLIDFFPFLLEYQVGVFRHFVN